MHPEDILPTKGGIHTYEAKIIVIPIKKTTLLLIPIIIANNDRTPITIIIKIYFSGKPSLKNIIISDE